MSNTLDRLQNVIVPAISGPDRAYCVTVACKSTDGDGEVCHIASALGRLHLRRHRQLRGVPARP